MNEALPFETYPGRGRQLIEPIGAGDNGRQSYCLRFQQVTGQHKCAYCGMDLVDTFEHWLQMCLDNVVPVGVCSALKIQTRWRHDALNKVLCCSACAGFTSRYMPEFRPAPIGPDNLEAFCDLRDRTFEDRKEKITARRNQERDFYETALTKALK